MRFNLNLLSKYLLQLETSKAHSLFVANHLLCAVCELKPYIDNGKAVDKAGAGKDASYTFQCDDGYRLKKESGNTAFCNKIGQAVYPACEKCEFLNYCSYNCHVQMCSDQEPFDEHSTEDEQKCILFC